MDLRKKLMMTLLGLGVVGALASVGGTAASFTAVTTNPGNAFTAGTLLMKNTGGSAATCGTASASIGSTAPNCGYAVSIPSSMVPGDSVINSLTVTNAGSLPALTMALAGANTTGYTTGCKVSDPLAGTSCASNIAADLTLKIEDQSSGLYCVTTPAGGACAGAVAFNSLIGASHALPNAACITGGACPAVPSATQQVWCGSSSLTLTTPAVTCGAAEAAHVYKITVSFPNGAAGADNIYQGLSASLDMTWSATQPNAETTTGATGGR